jgi:hypothetical protein
LRIKLPSVLARAGRKRTEKRMSDIVAGCNRNNSLYDISIQYTIRIYLRFANGADPPMFHFRRASEHPLCWGGLLILSILFGWGWFLFFRYYFCDFIPHRKLPLFFCSSIFKKKKNVYRHVTAGSIYSSSIFRNNPLQT